MRPLRKRQVYEHSNIHIKEVPEGEECERIAEKISEELIAKNITNLKGNRHSGPGNLVSSSFN